MKPLLPPIHRWLGRWQMEPSSPEDLANVDVVVVHDYSNQVENSSTNIIMTDLAIKHCRAFSKPLICQAPCDRYVEMEGFEPVLVIRENQEKPGKYLDTQAVNAQVARYCKPRGWIKIGLYAYTDHQYRAGRNLIVNDLKPFYFDTRFILPDPLCGRPWLANARLFRLRERFVGRPLYIVKRLM